MSVAALIEAYIPFPDDGRSRTRYIGEPDVLDVTDQDDPRWTIHRFSHVLLSDNRLVVDEVDVRYGVAWSAREDIWA